MFAGVFGLVIILLFFWKYKMTLFAYGGLVGEGVKKNPEQVWAHLLGVLFNSFPIFIPNLCFFFLSHTNS